MATRFKTGAHVNYGQQPLQSGYEQVKDVPDIFIPSCGVEDVDVALFSLFKDEIVPQVTDTDGGLRKVPIIFAAGEKWAMLKKGRPVRDRNNTLILPLITVMRSEITQSPSEDIVGRGINQHVGEIVVRRKLDKSDRGYQALINRLLLPNQDNLQVASTPGSSTDVGSLRTRGDEALSDPDVVDGAILKNDRTNNVYETIVVPTPQFYTAKYEVTIWTQYTKHANQIIEKVMTSFLPQSQSWRLDTAKGYWFIAYAEEGITSETNFDDMSSSERFIKHTININIPAYFFATATPGGPVPIKRYVSSPIVSFEADVGLDVMDMGEEAESQYVLGSDDPTLPIDTRPNDRPDQRTPGMNMQRVYPIEDPALSSDRRGPAIRTVSKNSKGETVYSGASLGGLQIVLTK